MYLIYGESFRLIEEEIQKIIKNETNSVTIDLMDSNIEDVLTEATYVSMFEESKFIIVKNALLFTSNKEKEEDVQKLLNYMENPVPSTTIIFTTYEKIDNRKKVTKAFEKKYKIINVGGLSKMDLIAKGRELIFKNKYKIENETLEYITESCQNNYDLIYNEIQKLFLYYETPSTIRLEDVKEIISKSIVDNNFKFIEAIVNKNLKKALFLLEDLYRLKIDPIVLVRLLAREYRLMYQVKFLMSKGYYKKDIGKRLKMQEWQIDKLSKNSSDFYEEDLKNFIKKIADLDYKIVSGNDDKFLIFKSFLLETF
ncbi:MAG: DNA polymerase III subunit delta [Bacilli bacterium]|nr:DNA polymerase III subunit delta [Bacilli bacterium]